MSVVGGLAGEQEGWRWVKSCKKGEFIKDSFAMDLL